MTLIERLEAATGGSRELDAEIAIELFPDSCQRSEYSGNTKGGHIVARENGTDVGMTKARPYTTSIDAALTLVPDNATSWDCGRIDNDFLASVEFPVDVDGFHNFHAKSQVNAATALCLAALKARNLT